MYSLATPLSPSSSSSLSLAPLVIFFPVSYLIHQCGVITSSCEVAASMLLSKEEFMEIKTELVEGMFDTVNLLFLKSQMIRMALTQYFD